MKKAALLLLLLLPGDVALSQCWGQASVAPVGVIREEWVEHPSDPNRIYLYRNSLQVGGWDYDHGYWRDYDAGRDVWGDPVQVAPKGLPLRGVQNFGVDPSKLGHGGRCQLNGKEATRKEIDAAIADIPDDSKKFRLVATGDIAERAKITEAWKQVEPELKSRVALWSVPADHWSLQDTVTGKRMFVAGGMTFQAPSGKVLHRQADFTGTEDFGAIRKAVKEYDAGQDPDLRRPWVPSPLVPTPPGPQPGPLPVDPKLPAPMPQPTPPGNSGAPLLGLLASFVASYFLTKKG